MLAQEAGGIDAGQEAGGIDAGQEALRDTMLARRREG